MNLAAIGRSEAHVSSPEVGRRRRLRWLWLLVAAPWPLSAARADDGVDFFEREVRPILVDKCQKCHGEEKQKGGLRLDSRAAILEGGDTGPAADPANVDESLIVEAIAYDGDLKMPPRSKLGDAEIRAIRRWVGEGLPWPESAASGPKSMKGVFDLAARRAGHWSWAPVRPPALPAVADPSWSANPIDRFLLAKLEANALRPAAEADRRVLIRRLTFDLIGLPPAPEEVEAFVADPAGDALERLVDRLLASPRFGERWARHWMDLVRYAETRGHEYDPAIPNAYQYRDYLIRAFNTDVPYDQFVREHIAGDLLAEPRRGRSGGSNESILGTAFWYLDEEVHSPVDIRQDETDRIDNRLDVFGKTFLGLTIACARCHDHKFDAISQKDYYALGGFLLSSAYRQARFETMEQEKAIARRLDALRDEARRNLLPAFARNRRPALDQAAAMLGASLALIRAGVADLPFEERPLKIADLAEQTKLDPDRLSRWLQEVARARTDAKHLFAPLVKLAIEANDHDPAQFEQQREAIVAAVRKRLPAEAAGSPPRVVVDYATLPPESWRADGFGFGTRPLRPGDLLLRGDAERPRVEVMDRAAAYRDSSWPGVKVPKGEPRDHGVLGTWDRSGQTLLTPNFTLGTGQLWYLVRGPVRAYAAVDSHLLVAGPLHGGLMAEFKGEDDWQWVRHDLSAYAGHRVHIEFSPGVPTRQGGPGGPPGGGGGGGQGFGPGGFGGGPPTVAIALVVESDTPPAAPADPLDVLTLELLGDPAIAGPEALARAYQDRLIAASEWLGRGESAGGAPVTIDSYLGRWLTARSFLLESPDFGLRLDQAEILGLQNELLARVPAESHTAPALLDGNGVDEFLLIRGNSRTPAGAVPRRFLEAIPGETAARSGPTTSGRLELAERVASVDNPLTARVMVNRVWHHLFGRGLVASVDNFGVLGDAPTHPELLDHLAGEFVRDGWSVKRLIRSIATSRAYRMASRADEVADRADPDDLLLHKARVRRLQGESIRDAILAVSGRLDATEYGPSVPVHLTAFMQGRGRPGNSGPADGGSRRSLYLEIRRNFLSPFLLAFDAPIPFSSMGRRNVSNVPAQALILLNDPFVLDQSARWADRVLADPAAAPEARVRSMYRSAFARDPSAGELADALEFVAAQATEHGGDGDAGRADHAAWADLAHVLFNAKEFVFLE